ERNGGFGPEERSRYRTEVIDRGDHQRGIVHAADAAQVIVHRDAAAPRDHRLHGRGERFRIRAVGRTERERNRAAVDDPSRTPGLDRHWYGAITVRDEGQPGGGEDLLRQEPE